MAQPTPCARAHATPNNASAPPSGAHFEPLPLLTPSPFALAEASDGLHASWARLEDAARAIHGEACEPTRAQLRTAARLFVAQSDRCYRQWLAMEGDGRPRLDITARGFRAIHTHVESIERVDREVGKAWRKLEHWARRHAEARRAPSLRRAALVWVTWVDARAFLAACG